MQKDYDKIISETINRYIGNILKEDEDKDGRVRKNAIKKRGGIRGDYKSDDDSQDVKVSDEEQSSISKILDSGLINMAELGDKMYPELSSRQSAQSKFRKKAEQEKSDSGSTYKFSRGEMKKLRKILATEL